MITDARNPPWPSDVSLNDLPAAGLRFASVFRCKLLTLDAGLILGRIGRSLAAIGLPSAVRCGPPWSGSVRAGYGRRRREARRGRLLSEEDHRRELAGSVDDEEPDAVQELELTALGSARDAHALDPDPLSERRDDLAGEPDLRERQGKLHRAEPRLDAPPHQRALAAILEDEVVSDEIPYRVGAELREARGGRGNAEGKRRSAARAVDVALRRRRALPMPATRRRPIGARGAPMRMPAPRRRGCAAGSPRHRPLPRAARRQPPPSRCRHRSA